MNPNASIRPAHRVHRGTISPGEEQQCVGPNRSLQNLVRDREFPGEGTRIVKCLRYDSAQLERVGFGYEGESNFASISRKYYVLLMADVTHTTLRAAQTGYGVQTHMYMNEASAFSPRLAIRAKVCHGCSRYS